MTPQRRLEKFINYHGLHDKSHAEKKLKDPKFCREYQDILEECVGVKFVQRGEFEETVKSLGG